MKILGRTLEVLALTPMIVSVILLNMKDKDLGIIVLLLVIANVMFFIGLILSYLPQEPSKDVASKIIEERLSREI